MLKKLFCYCLLLLSPPALGDVTVQLVRNPVPCYEIAALSCYSSVAVANPFISIHFTAQFTSPDGQIYAAEGFYNGSQTWWLRFMPNQTGVWSFSWRFGDHSGAGSFTCSPKQNLKLHGHIYVDPSNLHKIRHEDGTPLHWIGGKYIDFDDPYYLDATHSSVLERIPKADYLPLVQTYLQRIAEKGLNGIVLKLRVLPINDDLVSMDLDFLATADEIMQWCMDLGINVQLNFLDTWGKRKPGADIRISNPPTTDLLLEPHYPDTYVEATAFYFRYLIARYAAYPNIVWELWNEAERMKVSAAAATAAYVPYFQLYDPYHLPISASEIHAGGYPVQITSLHAGWKCSPSNWNFTHGTTLYPPLYYAKYAGFAGYGYSNNRPILWNECYPDDGQTEYYTLPATLDWFRATFWGNLTAGCIGTSEFCWADIRQVPNLVTDYHQYFADFVRLLIDVNALDPAGEDEIETSSGTATMCRKLGKEYVIYHFTKLYNSQSRFQLKLPVGNYYFQYYNPKNGQSIGPRTLLSQGYFGWRAFDTPGFNQDIVLYVVEESYSQLVVPVELAYFSVYRRDDGVHLLWRTESESNNYGFDLERSLDDGRTFVKIAFIPGHGTTSYPQEYAHIDRPPAVERLSYRLVQLDVDGARHLYPAESVQSKDAKPEEYTVRVYPNPGHEPIQLQFHLAHQQQLRYTIYNTRQQLVYQSDWKTCSSGEGSLLWEGRDLSGGRVATGLYFYRLENRGDPLGLKTAVGRFIYLP